MHVCRSFSCDAASRCRTRHENLHWPCVLAAALSCRRHALQSLTALPATSSGCSIPDGVALAALAWAARQELAVDARRLRASSRCSRCTWSARGGFTPTCRTKRGATRVFGSGPREWFGWDRNHYDRLVHLAFGLLMPLPIVETAMRYGGLSRRWALGVGDRRRRRRQRGRTKCSNGCSRWSPRRRWRSTTTASRATSGTRRRTWRWRCSAAWSRRGWLAASSNRNQPREHANSQRNPVERRWLGLRSSFSCCLRRGAAASARVWPWAMVPRAQQAELESAELDLPDRVDAALRDDRRRRLAALASRARGRSRCVCGSCSSRSTPRGRGCSSASKPSAPRSLTFCSWTSTIAAIICSGLAAAAEPSPRASPVWSLGAVCHSLNAAFWRLN